MAKKKKTSRELHQEAMQCSFRARLGKNKITSKKEAELYEKAFELEKQSAMMLLGKSAKKVEPTRSILFRSAGWMAVKAKMYKEAKEMAELGLKNVIHAEIKEELNGLLSEIKKKLTTKRK